MARAIESSTAENAWRHAVMRHLEKEPFTADRFALYASYLHETAYKPAAFVYFFSRSRTLLSSRILFAGLEKEPSHYCRALPDMLAESGAASLGISLCYPDGSISQERIHLLSRIVLFCEMQKLPFFEAILLCGEDAVPLCRACGETSLTVLHPKGSGK